MLFVEHNSLGTLVQGSAATGQPSIELPMVNESAKCIFVLDHLCKINSNGLDTCFIIINFVSNIFFSLFDSLLHFFFMFKNRISAYNFVEIILFPYIGSYKFTTLCIH